MPGWPGLPATPESGLGLAEIATAFGHELHAAGLAVTPQRSACFAHSVMLAHPTDITDLYWVARTTLVTSRDQIPLFDQVFARVFEGIFNLSEYREVDSVAPSAAEQGFGSDSGGDRPSRESLTMPRTTSGTPGGDGVGESESEASALAALSAQERINERPFSELTDAERELISQLVERLPLIPPMRKGRRSRVHHHGRRWDVRASLRAAHRTGGDPVKRVMREREPRPRKIVLLADVSGSMEPYSRIYLHLMRGAVKSIDAEAFVFATRLTRISRALAGTFTEAAYQQVARSACDWSGGTRIGDSLFDFVNRFGRPGMARGAVVVIVSDGWETGDPGELARAMSQLSRLAHHVIWVNPRKAATGYQPLVGGMAAAMPYVDTFLSGHSMSALTDVMTAISQASMRASSVDAFSR